MTSAALAAYMAVVDAWKLRSASSAELAAAERAFAGTPEGRIFLSAPGGPLEHLAGSATVEPTVTKEVVVTDQVVVDRGAYEALVRAAGAAPLLVAQAKAALPGAPPGGGSAPGATADLLAAVRPEPSDAAWEDFEATIRIPGRRRLPTPLGEVWVGGKLSAGAEVVTDGLLDAFAASLGLGAKGGRR